MVKYRNENTTITDSDEHHVNIYFKWYFFHALFIESIKKSFLQSILVNKLNECINIFNSTEIEVSGLLHNKINKCINIILKLYNYIKRYYEKDSVYIYTIDLLNNNLIDYTI